jgi:hypothetical protein
MGAVVAYFKVLSQHLLQITEESHQKFRQDSLSPGQLSNLEPSA